MQLEGKSIVVMGAGSGVGRATALRFAEEGAKVVVADVDLERAKETVQLIEEAGGTAIADQCDVSQEADVEATIALAVSSFGRLDIIFNNVGVPTPRPGLIFEEHTVDDFDRLFAINAKGVFNGSKYAIKQFKAAGRRRRDPQHRVGRRPRVVGRQRVRLHQGRGAPAHQGRGHRGRAVRHPLQRDLPGGDAVHQLHQRHGHDGHRGGQGADGDRASARCTRSASRSPPRTAPRPRCTSCPTAAKNVTGVLLPVDGGYVAR